MFGCFFGHKIRQVEVKNRIIERCEVCDCDIKEYCQCSTTLCKVEYLVKLHSVYKGIFYIKITIEQEIPYCYKPKEITRLTFKCKHCNKISTEELDGYWTDEELKEAGYRYGK